MPTATAISNANEAKTIVPITFPASRAAVEKIAAANAPVRPIAANKKRIQAPEFSLRKLFARFLREPNWVPADICCSQVSTRPECCQVTSRVERVWKTILDVKEISAESGKILRAIPRMEDVQRPA